MWTARETGDVMLKRSVLALVTGLIVVGTVAAADEPAKLPGGPTVESRNGIVVSVSRLASETGRDVLHRGGNAVDAAVATAFALAVTWPEAGNLGGGGFMLVHPAPGKGEPTVFDYRETAPTASTRDMFAAKGPPSSYLMVGVPGTVRGLALAHSKAGKLPWKDLVAPAIKLAADGFIVDEGLAKSLNRGLFRARSFPEFQRVLGKPDGSWKAGDRLVLPDLAATLKLVAENGPDVFYKGPVAEKIVAEMKRGNGIITAADLAGYEAKERKPIHGTYSGFDVYAPPPPSSGGICLVEMLNILENFDLTKYGRFSAATHHLMAESMRRAYCDRARYLGDPAFAKIPDDLTDKEYARKLAASIDLDKATPSLELAKDIPIADEKEHTTHFSVIDRDGMAVSNTFTLEDSFGGKVMVRGAGFLLNNEMGDFNPRPGVTTKGGQIGTPPNDVAPGKRMLSSMCPTILASRRRVYLVTGSPGGRTIINTVLCVVVNAAYFRIEPRYAVDNPRIHHQWLPDRIVIEGALSEEYPEVVAGLKARGHVVSGGMREKQGDAHTICYGRNGYVGVADRRLSGWAAGN
jgi:gamma-glutamyltranspeptidase/glutathione hydrolase